jgi:hypothetical protein
MIGAVLPVQMKKKSHVVEFLELSALSLIASKCQKMAIMPTAN